MIINPVTNEIYRGSRPEEIDILMLKSNYKIKTILSLENDKLVVQKEEQFCIKNNIKFRNSPLSEIFPPSSEKLKKLVMYLWWLEKSVFIHCLHGADRTGFVIAAYRMIEQGWALEKVYQECLDMEHNVFWYWWWKRSLIKINKKLRKEVK